MSRIQSLNCAIRICVNAWNSECMEHVVTLRLITNTARLKTMILFVVFCKFFKGLWHCSKTQIVYGDERFGMMLAAVMAMYPTTESVICSAILTVSQKFRQGSPTSCLLLIIFVNVLIGSIKKSISQIDLLYGYKWMTVLLSTSRANMYTKLRILKEYCNGYGMRVNSAKTSFICHQWRDRRQRAF